MALIMNGPEAFRHPTTGASVGPYQWYEGFAHTEHEIKLGGVLKEEPALDEDSEEEEQDQDEEEELDEDSGEEEGPNQEEEPKKRRRKKQVEEQTGE